MSYQEQNYEASGETTFQIGFVYLDPKDVLVSVDGVQQTTDTYTINEDTDELTFSSSVSGAVRIYRNTDYAYTQYYINSGTEISQASLNGQYLHSLFVAEESFNNINTVASEFFREYWDTNYQNIIDTVYTTLTEDFGEAFDGFQETLTASYNSFTTHTTSTYNSFVSVVNADYTNFTSTVSDNFTTYTANTTQTLTADLENKKQELEELIGDLQALATNAIGVPVGFIIETPLNFSNIYGYLPCNGAEISRSDFPELWEAIKDDEALQDQTTWNTNGRAGFSSGNGTTTFNIPDRRGVHIRGADEGRGFDASREIGTYQEDMFKSHSHNFSTLGVERPSAILTTFSTSAGTISQQTASPDRTWNWTYIANTGGNETRGKNVSTRFFVKYIG